MNILVIGNNTVDQVWMTNGILQMGQKKTDNEFEVFAGGQAANCAVALAMLGCKVNYIGAFGSDQFGKISRQSMSDSGINIDWSKIEDCPNYLATVIVDKISGERSILMYKDSRLELSDHIIMDDWLDNIDLLYTDGHEPVYSCKCIKRAYEKNIPIIADAEEVNSYLKNYLPYITTLIAPLEVFRELSKQELIENVLEEVKEMGPISVIATNGENGGYALDAQNRFHRYEAIKCDVVDTTGAGDAFHAGYMIGCKNNLSFKQSVKYAAIVASKKCQVKGPRIKKDNICELIASLEELKNEECCSGK